jgi:PAS domain S-box-containing protein
MSSEEQFKHLAEEINNLLRKHDVDPPASQDFFTLKKLFDQLKTRYFELQSENEKLIHQYKNQDKKQTLFRKLFENSPSGILIINTAGKIIQANEAAIKLFATQKEQLEGFLLENFIMPSSYPTLRFHLQNSSDADKTASCVLNLQRLGEKAAWIQLESKPFVLDENDMPCIVSVITDLTGLKKKEEELLLFSKAFEQSANSIMITNTSGVIEYANPSFFQLTEYLPEEVIGQTPRIIKHEKSQIDYNALWETISSGGTWKGEFLNRSKTGKLFWEIATITPVKDQSGNILKYLAIKENITQRKIAEQNLQKARDYYFGLLEEFPAMVWLCDEKGHFTFFNKTLSSFTGADNLSKYSFPELIFPNDLLIFNDSFNNSIRNRSSFIVEYRLKNRFGNYRWVLNHARPFYLETGEFGGFIAACTDIHERRLTEEKLTESDNRLRRMFEDSSMGIFRLNRNFQIVSANKAFASMFGYTDTLEFIMDINNRPSEFFYNYEEEKDFRRQLVRSQENRFIIEKRLVRKDKTSIYVTVHLRKVYERSHKKGYFMEGFIEDITNRKIAEQKLQFSEQKFRALFEKSYDAIIIIENGYIVDCNKKASDIFHLEYYQLINKPFAELAPEDLPEEFPSRSEVLERIKSALDGHSQTFEWLLSRGETTFYAEVSFARIFMNNKYMVQTIVRDISEKKIAEKQLKQARDDAEKARMAQSEFLSLMSHEIRTPLNAVISLTDLMLHEEQSPDQQENLISVKISARHLLGLIDDILDYNKIESGNIQFDAEDFDIRHMVEQLRRALGIKATEKDIRLITVVDEQVPLILRADTLRLKQILFNLISNAIKFTDQGNVRLHIRKKEDAENVIEFEVKDTGIGISESRLEAIFERFTQEQSYTARKYGGSGLGLAICKKLVELQEGQIKAASVKGEGSVFTFFIPMESGNVTMEDKAREYQMKDSHTLKGMKILMVEDDRMNQFVGRKIIEKKWNAHLTIVETGEDALAKLKQEEFDVVLLDILLPGMDGYQTAQNIRRNEKNEVVDPEIPIIALTADAFVETRTRAYEAGMNDFVSKPFDYENLFKKLFAYKNRTSGRSSLST